MSKAVQRRHGVVGVVDLQAIEGMLAEGNRIAAEANQINEHATRVLRAVGGRLAERAHDQEAAAATIHRLREELNTYYRGSKYTTRGANRGPDWVDLIRRCYHQINALHPMCKPEREQECRICLFKIELVRSVGVYNIMRSTSTQRGGG